MKIGTEMLIGGLVGAATLLIVTSCVGCTGAPQQQQVVTALQVEDTSDFVAVAFVDCNELNTVLFFGRSGRAEAVKVNNAVGLIDIQLRMARVAYERVYYINNPRPCGFEIDETEAEGTTS